MNDVTIVMLAGILSGMIIGATLIFVIFAPKILVLEKENYKLGRNQKIHTECVTCPAVLSEGEEHGKYCPYGIAIREVTKKRAEEFERLYGDADKVKFPHNLKI